MNEEGPMEQYFADSENVPKAYLARLFLPLLKPRLWSVRVLLWATLLLRAEAEPFLLPDLQPESRGHPHWQS